MLCNYVLIIVHNMQGVREYNYAIMLRKITGLTGGWDWTAREMTLARQLSHTQNAYKKPLPLCSAFTSQRNCETQKARESVYPSEVKQKVTERCLFVSVGSKETVPYGRFSVALRGCLLPAQLFPAPAECVRVTTYTYAKKQEPYATRNIRTQLKSVVANVPTPGVMKLATASAACSYVRMRLCGRLTCMPDCPAQMQVVSVTVLVTAIAVWCSPSSYQVYSFSNQWCGQTAISLTSTN